MRLSLAAVVVLVAACGRAATDAPPSPAPSPAPAAPTAVESSDAVSPSASTFACTSREQCGGSTVCCVAAGGSTCTEPADCSFLSWQSMPCRSASDCPQVPVFDEQGRPAVGTLQHCGPLPNGPPELHVCRFGGGELGIWP